MSGIRVKQGSLIFFVGVPGCGKSTFGEKVFAPYQILSSDAFRGMLTNDESNQGVSGKAFELINTILDFRLASKLTTVIDATNLVSRDRRTLINIGKKYGAETHAFVFDVPFQTVVERNQSRNRVVPLDVLEKYQSRWDETWKVISNEADVVTVIDTSKTYWIDEVSMVNQFSQDTGPFDIIGDIHGCYDELILMIGELGYNLDTYTHPEGRKLVFVGDYVDRGPDSVSVLNLVHFLISTGRAYGVVGNHDNKFMRYLLGRKVTISHGLDLTINQIDELKLSDKWKESTAAWLGNLPHHLILDNGRLVVAHGGLIEEWHGIDNDKTRSMCLYGLTTGEKREDGYPVRIEWGHDYTGQATVVYGHTPHAEPNILNNTYNIDTGCVFGNKLTALKYPEMELVTVQALAVHDTRPITPAYFTQEVEAKS